MNGLAEGVTNQFLEFYSGIVNLLPDHLKILPPLFIIALIIAIYSVFTWYFYRSLAQRDILKLNLARYNTSKHPVLIKLLVIFFYTLEYIIIAPIAILIWFSIFSVVFILLAKEIKVGTVILISAALIAAVRITAYFSQDLSKDLAKMFPFTLLGVVILTPGFFNMDTSIVRILEVPLFFREATYYFIFIVALEILLRMSYIPVAFIKSLVIMKRKDQPED